MMPARRAMTALFFAAAVGVPSWPGAHAAAVVSSAPLVQQSAPPFKAEVVAQTATTTVKAIRTVQPRYTREAMEHGIQGSAVVECSVLEDGSVGSARITRSLDPVYGLDEEALNAARQWRFEPARKDGVAVTTTVTIDMTFRLARAPPRPPAPLSWPDAFPPDGKAPAAGDWYDVEMEAQGLKVKFAYPTGWTLRTNGPAASWFDFVSNDFTRLVVVGRPYASYAREAERLSSEELNKRAATTVQGFRKSGSQAILHGVGQVKAAGLLWEWTDYSAPAGDPAIAQRFRSRAYGMQGRVRLWHFRTTREGQAFSIYFRVAHPDGTEEASANVERQAAAQFASILGKMSFKRQ